MNKEELLRRLNEIKDQLDTSNISTLQVEANKNYRDVQRQLELEADELLTKINNDSNYKHNVGNFRDSRKEAVENKIAEIDAELARNSATVPANNVTIASRSSEIDAAHFLIEAGKKEIDAYNEILKEAQDKNDIDTENKMKENIHNTELAISELETETTQNGIILNLAKMDLEKANSRNTELEDLKKQYANSIQGIDDRISDTSIINETEREEDRRKYNKLQDQIKNIDKNYDDNFRTYDFYGNVESLIAGVTDGTISNEEAFKRVQEIKNNITENFYIYSNDKERNKKIEQNIKSQEFYTVRISELEKKLSNKDENYLVSIFQEEAVKDEIDARIKSDEATLITLENQKKAIERKISMSKDPSDEIQKLMHDLRRLGNNASEEEINKIQKNLNKLYKSRDKNLDKRNQLEKQKESIDQEIALVRSRISNSKKELKEKDEKPILNIAAIAADEADLKRSKDMLVSLKANEKILNKDLESQLDSLATDLSIEKPEEKKDEGMMALPPIKPDEKSKPIPIVDWAKAKKDSLIEKIKNNETLNKVKDWAKKNKIRIAALAGAIMLLGGAFASCESNQKDKSESSEPIKQTQFTTDIPRYPYQTENYIKDNHSETEVEEPVVEETPTSVTTPVKKTTPDDTSKKTTVVNPETPDDTSKETTVVTPVVPDTGDDQTLPDMEDDTPTNDTGSNDNSGETIDNGGSTDTGSNTDDNNTGDNGDTTDTDDNTNDDDKQADVTYTINPGETFYHKSTTDGNSQTEVVSNEDTKTSEEAANDYTDQTGQTATGNTTDFNGITDVVHNADGTVSVGVDHSQSDDNDTTLVEDIQNEIIVPDGSTQEQEINRQKDDLQALLDKLNSQSEQATDEQIQSEGGMTK